MNIRDISNDTETIYRLMENERAVFVMENRADETVFELAGAGAEAHIFSLLSGREKEAFEPKIVVRHLAPDTRSRTDVRAVLDGSASLRFRGRVEVSRDAVRSDAREDVRVLLLSSASSASAAPELEIDTDDVSCTHGAAIAPPDPEQLAYLATRGLSAKQATELLARGFFKEARERIRKYES